MALTRIKGTLLVSPAEDVASVIAIMTAIETTLGQYDGVAWFNRLYRKVTERVAAELGAGTFEDPEFVARLDVVFANYCFAALKTYLDGSLDTPRAWYPLFEANDRKGLARLQFALAGMNAHINRDLMRAVVDVCQERGIDPRHDSPQRRDFDRLNPMLEAVEKQVHAWYLKDDGPLFDELETLLSTWSLVQARSAAWHQAAGLWTMREAATIENAYLFSIDKFVGFTSRSLLVPLPKQSCLARLLARARAAQKARAAARAVGTTAAATTSEHGVSREVPRVAPR
jgi:hypothetical protein